MRILVLGAGAIGGYFGGRLLQAGADVHFLVRERRAAQLAANGLVVRSPLGNFRVEAPTVSAAEPGPAPDLILLSCKAFDLDSAIEAIAPCVGPHTHILPLLNGLLHLDRLQARFGAERVAGGSCVIPATLTPAGEVVQLNPMHRTVFGPLAGTSTEVRPKLQTLQALYQRGPVDAVLSDQMMLAMWEKFVGLCSLAAMTCLMRGAICDILAADEGRALMQEAFDTCATVAQAHGQTPRPDVMAGIARMMFDPTSTTTASMLRDLESGGRVEAAHIVGDMVARARAVSVNPGILGVAWCHLQAAEHRRGRLG